jgi:hypothetical protein
LETAKVASLQNAEMSTIAYYSHFFHLKLLSFAQNKSRMKKTLPLFILLAIFIASCKKDQNNPSNYSKNIVGKWYWVEQQYGSQVFTPPQLDTASYFEFDADGTFYEDVQFSNGELLHGNYHITGDSLIVKRDEDQAAVHYGIKTLTSTSLVIDAGYIYTMKKK